MNILWLAMWLLIIEIRRLALHLIIFCPVDFQLREVASLNDRKEISIKLIYTRQRIRCMFQVNFS